MIEPEELPEIGSSQVTNLSQTEVHTVNAELVRMRQADAELINAKEVELEQSAAANVKADQIHAHQSAMANVNATEFVLQQGAVAFVRAERATVSGVSGAVLANSAEVKHGLAAFVAGREVHVDDSRTVVLLARNVSGSVTTLFSTRDALILGLVSGLFSGMMLLLGRLLFRRE